MNEHAAIWATYSDLRFVKSRKVAQITLEIPIEEAANVVALFGTPNPASEIWVALARLSPAASEGSLALSSMGQAAPKEKRRFSELPPAQQAALTCQREAFWKFIAETQQYGVQSEDDAAGFVREWCAVRSRSDLNTNPAATEAWDRLRQEFDDWLRLPTF